MEVSSSYLPQAVFAPQDQDFPAPRVFISPQRYIQGRGVIHSVGRYLSLMQARRAGVLMSQRSSRNEGEPLLAGLRSAGVDAVVSTFQGECTSDEITTHTTAFSEERIDCVIAAGGGKCIDTGKAIAFRLGIPVVVVPTLASNDAPCSALSVLYSPEGISEGVEFYPNSPALVVVDTDIIAAAPERYLVAGMGDAMATWYEARICLLNPAAVTAVGARPTLASCAIGEVCAHTLFQEGCAAAAAVSAKTVNEALESVVEANTLLSGLGFESGGLAGAHAVAQSYTAISHVRDNYLHGEMVAMGTLAQLMMESRPEEAIRVAEFFATVGLPVHLGQLSLAASDTDAIDLVSEAALGFPFVSNMPMPVTTEFVRSAILKAHHLGLSVSERVGDSAYRRLQG
ncbi:glycerol dehydrogenase [Synechococcus elongatus]|uniref:Glycerol dehydrogenase n=1 Tax=Synechococcus elongatus PCC 11801 TaxID=2219813 RepID=A0AAN1QP40_SYNEL|nr:glycerol dehydrogenase [Synechococcus elongatus]AZB72771.1 glycerol dehydrogenase [Synechococcus elongatus PCC 11801]